MARPLNVKLIETAKAHPARRIEIPDGGLVGLYLVIQPSGSKSWAVRYRHGGRPAKLTLGPYPRLDLRDAREAGREALRHVSKGLDPTADKVTLARLKREPKPAADHSFEKVLERFIASQERKGRRSSGEMRRILEKDALPYWSGRPIESITPADVVERVEAIVDRGRPVAASRFRAWCSKLFSYAVKSQLRPDNPAKGVEDPVEPSTLRRDRKLEDDELVLVWQAAEKLGYPFGPLFQILLLTGQRLREVAEARWSEFDLRAGTWTIPGSRAKNGAEHRVALSQPALAILSIVPRLRNSTFVFTTTGAAPVSGFSKAKGRLDKFIVETNGGEPLPAWRLHDLRRSFVSGCARLRIPAEVVERAINHVSESFGGVRGVYNVHAYEEERRGAFEAWAAYVMQLHSRDSGRPAALLVAS
jgi:integrase